MAPVFNAETYFFCLLPKFAIWPPMEEVIGTFREAEGVTVIVRQEVADRLQ